jgi:hypothetical protein
VVNRMLRRVEQVTGRGWLEAVGKELRFSECILYGVYADQFERAEYVTLTGESLCHSYWDNVPLTAGQAAAWLSSARQDDVAYMISAKSHTNVRTTCRPRQRVRQLSARGYREGCLLIGPR